MNFNLLLKRIRNNYPDWYLILILLLAALVEYLPHGIIFIQAGEMPIFAILHNMAGLLWMSFPFYLALGAPVLVFSPNGIKIYLRIILPIVLGMILLHLFLFFGFHITLERGLFYVLLSSGKEEVHEFINGQLSSKVWVMFFSFTALGVFLIRHLLRLNWKPRKRTPFFALCLVLPLFLSATRFIVIGEPAAILYRVSCLRVIQDLIAVYLDQDQLYLAIVKKPMLPPKIELISPRMNTLRGIIVIGESATRSHHGLYGYPRNTTPYQSNVPGLLAFSQVYSAAPVTGISLKYTLTFATLTTPEDYRCTLIALLKSAGIRTAWLSAQRERCSSDALFFHGADRVLYSDVRTYDDALLDLLPQAVAGWENVPHVIFLHLNGSHVDYSRRYPPEAKVFTDLPPEHERLSKEEVEAVNHYDNSIAFTDSVLEKLQNYLAATDQPTFLVYFSDHGEDPSKNAQRTSRNWMVTDPIFYEIPFWVWFSPAYQAIRPEFVETARYNQDKTMQLDRGGIATLCDIAGVRFQNFPVTEDLLHPEFQPQSIYLQSNLFKANRSNHGLFLRRWHYDKLKH